MNGVRWFLRFFVGFVYGWGCSRIFSPWPVAVVALAPWFAMWATETKVGRL